MKEGMFEAIVFQNRLFVDHLLNHVIYSAGINAHSPSISLSANHAVQSLTV